MSRPERSSKRWKTGLASKHARSWLSGVKGLSPSLGPQDKCGYVFRIPLDQTIPLQVGELSFQVQDVFLFYCIDREPELLVFDAKYRPYLLSVTIDPAPFLSEIGLKPGRFSRRFSTYCPSL